MSAYVPPTESSPARQSQRFAVVIPVGPNVLDLARAAAVLHSVLRWEPNLPWCVIVDDAPSPRGLSDFASIPSTCRGATVISPRRGRGGSWRGGLTAGLLTALAWVHRETDADFVLKLDTDALAIAPFAQAIHALLAQRRDAGVIGSLGVSCHPEVRRGQNLLSEPKFLIWRRVLPPASLVEASRVTTIDVDGWGPFTVDQLRAFDRIRPRLEAAIRHGYATNEYCQGGAYVLSREFVVRMAAAGYLTEPEAWVPLHFGEDVTMAMHARAVGLQVCDCSKPGQPFGIQYRGLAYPPEELVARGYSLIHSLKNDPHHSEEAIRAFFRTRHPRCGELKAPFYVR
jgi:hypothetical protein